MLEGYNRSGTSLYYEQYNDEEFWEIDRDKNIVVPRESVNLVGETSSQYIAFRMDRYWDGIDLSEMTFSIIYNADSGQADSDLAVNVMFNEEYVVFAWLVKGGVTLAEGNVAIQLQATGRNEKDDPYVWRSHIKTLKIDKSLNGDTIISERAELYNSFMEYVTGVLNGETGVIFAKVSRTLAEFDVRIAEIAASGGGNTNESEIADARVRKNGTVGNTLGEVVREKADGFVIEDNKLYLLSGGIKITDGVEIVSNLSDYYTREDIANILKDYFSSEDASTIVTDIQRSENGIIIYFKDGSTNDITIETSAAKAFETVEFDEESRKLHFYDAEGQDVYDPIYIEGGGGTVVATSRVVLTNETLVNGKSATTVPVPFGGSAKVKYLFEDFDSSGEQTGYNGTAVYTVNGEIVLETNIAQGSQVFEAKDYIKQGSNSIRVKVADEDGNYATKTWSMPSYALSFEDSYNEGDIQTNEFSYKYTPVGQLEKTIHFVVDGIEIDTAIITATGRQQTQRIPDQSYGAHKLEAWASADVNGVTLESNHKEHDIIWVKDGYTSSIVAATCPKSIMQYSTANVMFQAYTPGSMESTVELAVDGVVIAKRTVDRTLQTWAYRPEKYGTKELTISCGTATKILSLDVEDAGIEINPVESGRVFNLNPQGHSNEDEDKSWSDNGISTTVSDGFDWTNGGYQLDDEGNTCFVIKAGDRLTVHYNLFGDDARKAGKSFNFLFKTANIANYDAQVLSCLSGGIGLVLGANNGIMKSEQTTMDIPYCENDYLEFGLNIMPDSQQTRMVVLLNGIKSRTSLYALNDSFTQHSPVPITIGSDECDTIIYRIQAYTNNLTDDEIMDNYIANGRNTNEIVNRFNDNDICDEYGNIDPDKLAEVKPGLRVLKLDTPRFTTGKKDTVTGALLQQILKGGRAIDNWVSSTGLKFKGQGTSSEYYGDSARNLDFDFSGGFDFSDGTHGSVYSMTENSIGINYMNFKANVASSENANNACLADDYNIYQPYLRQARKNNPMVRDTMEFHPAVLFVRDQSGELFGDTDWHYYAGGDLGNSKKNSEAMGMDSDNPNECIIEVLNNTADQCRYKSDDLSSEKWDGNGNFEFRYQPTNVTDAKLAWQNVLSWVVSTDREQASGAAFPSAITYNGESYSKDTVEYRLAKFRAELEEHFILDSLLFHYLFTERHSMVDNRSKNTFVHSEDLVHWDYVFDYDNDTGDGNDNEGGLTLTYGLEDTDTIGAKNVFNAADNVLWCNLRDCFADKLTEMFIDRENAGAWNKDRILKKFKEYQSHKPVRLVNFDMWRKYERPYEESGITAYLPMMYGDKAPQRTQYETYQEPYMASKYQSPVCTEKVITLRCYTPTNWTGVAPENKITVTAYADMYLGLKVGSNVYKWRAKKGESHSFTFGDIGALNDTELYVFSAQWISGLDGLASLYVGYSNFAMAEKIQIIILGAGVDGYENTNLTSFSVGNNKLLKKVDIQGTPNLKSSLDLSGCVAVREVYAKNSGITGVIFAPGGLLEKAELSSPANLSMRNLKNLREFSLQSYTKLTTLRLEDCPVLDSYEFVTEATALTRVRITDINWNITGKELLDRLLTMGGMDENEYNIEQSVLIGTVTVNALNSYELKKYMQAWSNLDILYDLLIEVYEVIFQHPDGTVLDTQYIERGQNAEDPVTRAKNPIAVPVKGSSVDTVYTYAGWDRLLTAIIADRVITAVFSETVRQYMVRYFVNGSLMQSGKWDVYSKPEYTGEKPRKSDLEERYIYYLYKGWDKTVESLTSDTDINAVFQECILPAAPVDGSLYDFIYSDDSQDSMAYDLGAFYAILRSGKAEEYLAVKDKIKIVMNHASAIKDETIVLNVHSFGHYELADDSGRMSNVDFYMNGVLNQGLRINPTETNEGGWDASEIRTWVNKTLFEALPTHWKEMILLTYTLANAGNQSSTIVKSKDYLRLPSTAELGYDTTAIPYKNEVSENAKEIKFSQYVDNNSRRKSQFNGEGTAEEYWTRSAEKDGSSSFRFINDFGYSYTSYATVVWHLCVGFSV